MNFALIFLLGFIGYCQCKLVQFQCQAKRTIVDGHNNRRSQLAHGEIDGQPSAAEMKIMMWDDELAAKAAKWASRNQFQHNPDRTIGSGRFNTGENLYMYSTTDGNHKFDMDSALKSWFDEHKHYTYGPLKGSDFSGSHEQIGHYTQMAWSDSIYVGCGLSQFVGNNGMHNFLIVCNYGPTGNYIGQAPYRSGGPSDLSCSIDDCSQLYGDKCF